MRCPHRACLDTSARFRTLGKQVPSTMIMIRTRPLFRALCLFAVPGAIIATAAPAAPVVLLIAGEPSHGPGEHRFPEGCKLLAAALNAMAGRALLIVNLLSEGEELGRWWRRVWFSSVENFYRKE